MPTSTFIVQDPRVRASPSLSVSLWHGEQYATRTGASSSKQSKKSQQQKLSSFEVPHLDTDNSFSVPSTTSRLKPLKISSSNVRCIGGKRSPQTNPKQQDTDRHLAFGSSSINISSDAVSGAINRSKHRTIAETAVSLGAAVQKKIGHKLRASSENAGVEKPKRPLSAYNYFFQHERARLLLLIERGESIEDTPPVALKAKDVRYLLRNNPHATDRAKRPQKSHGKVGFTDLVKFMAESWKNVDDQTRVVFEEIACDDKARYRKQMRAYRAKLNALKTIKKLAASSPSGCFNESPTASDAAVEPTARKKLKTEEYPCNAARELARENLTPGKSGNNVLEKTLNKKDSLKEAMVVVAELPARSFSLCNTVKKITGKEGNGILEVGTMVDQWKTEKETTTMNFVGVGRNISPSASPPLGFDSDLLDFLKELDWTHT